MRRIATDKEFAELLGRGVLDAQESITVEGIPLDCKGAKRGDPRNCAFAHTLLRGDIDAGVSRSGTYRAMEATAELIAYNTRRDRRVKGLKPGDLVMVRYVNDRRLQEQIRVFDDQNRTFVPGVFTLLAPPKKKASRRVNRPTSRSQRTPKRLPQLTRIALLRRAGAP